MGKARPSVMAVFLATLRLTSPGQGSTGTLEQIKAKRGPGSVDGEWWLYVTNYGCPLRAKEGIFCILEKLK